MLYIQFYSVKARVMDKALNHALAAVRNERAAVFLRQS